MDPQACVRNFVAAIADGDYDVATESATAYEEWTLKGGFYAMDGDDSDVLRLDVEQERYLVNDGGIEEWRFTTDTTDDVLLMRGL